MARTPDTKPPETTLSDRQLRDRAPAGSAPTIDRIDKMEPSPGCP